jgi:hypothetical protein
MPTGINIAYRWYGESSQLHNEISVIIVWASVEPRSLSENVFVASQAAQTGSWPYVAFQNC